MMRFGSISITVTPTSVPSSWKAWVISFLRPKTAVTITLRRLYLYVHAGGQVEALERVDRARRGLLDVYETLVRLQLEVLARVLVLEGTPDHRVPAALRRQRDGAEDEGPGPLRGVDYRPRRLVYDLVVIGLELDPYLRYGHKLLQYLGDDAGANRPATLADGEVQTRLHSDGAYQLNLHHRVVPRHHHLHPLLKPYLPRHISRAEVELGTVLRKERRVPAPLLLREYIHLCLEAGVGRDRARSGQDLPSLYVISPHSS